jgi:hypothetical protein
MAKDNSVIVIPKLSSTMLLPKQNVVKTNTTNLQKIRDISNSTSYSLGVRSTLTKNTTSSWNDQVGVTYYLLKDATKLYLVANQFTEQADFTPEFSSNFGYNNLSDFALREPVKSLSSTSTVQLNNDWTLTNYRAYSVLETVLLEEDFDSNEKYYIKGTREGEPLDEPLVDLYNTIFKKIGTLNHRKINFAKDFVASYENLVQSNVLESHSKIVEISKQLLSQVEVFSTRTGNKYYLQPFDERLYYKTDTLRAPFSTYSIREEVLQVGFGLSRGVFYADNTFMPYRLICQPPIGYQFAVSYYNQNFNSIVDDFLQFYVPTNNVVIDDKQVLNTELETISKALTDNLVVESANITGNNYSLSTYNESGHIIEGGSTSTYYIAILKSNGTYETITPISINFILIGNDFLDSYRKTLRSTPRPPTLNLS